MVEELSEVDWLAFFLLQGDFLRKVSYSLCGREKKSGYCPLSSGIKKKAPNLKAICIDMGRPYTAAVKEYLPEIALVFDRFHVMQMVNKTVDKVRNRQQHHCNRNEYKVLKGNRFLFLANYDDLDDNQKHRVTTALEVNEPICIMHTMKEQLRILWQKKTRKKARKFLATWIMDALDITNDYETRTRSKTLQPLRRLALSLTFHMKGILNYFNHRITNSSYAKNHLV